MSVTAVLLCRNERHHIASCLQSVLSQVPPPGGFEIVVVDGISDDGTREILQRIAEQNAIVRIVDNPRRITPCAMNLGISAARGRWVAIMGAHHVYAPDYLLRCHETAKQTNADNVGGAMFCTGSSYIQRAVAAAHHSPFAIGGAKWHNPQYEGPADTVYGGFYRREVFDRIGLFDEELIRNQDDELNLRLTRAGGVIWQTPKVRCRYSPRNSLRALFGQYRQYGYWKVRVIRKHRLPASIRHLVPGGFVLVLLLLATLSVLAALGVDGLRPAIPLLAGLLGIYGSATLLAAAVTAAKAGWSLFPILPVVFACYHFGYGLGFLGGFWDFAIRRRGPSGWSSELTRPAPPSSSR